MGEFEAMGDAVTGAVAARAVEPPAGEAAAGHTHEAKCLNCGVPLAGPYCHECGQHAHVHRTLSAFFHDFAHGVLHFEGKIWRTLPMLVWKPGELTRRYIDGQRASFVSPVALFLFTVFLMFAAMELTGNTLGTASAVDARTGSATISALNAEKVTSPVVLTSSNMPEWIREAFEKAKENPELLFFKLKTNAYKFSWALIPISVPFVWLLFPFSRRFRLYDHTVFVTYSLSFMMLLLIASTLVGLISSTIEDLAWFVPPAHMYRQLRGAYGVSKLGAAWRTFALSIFAFIAISLFVSLLVTIGAFD